MNRPPRGRHGQASDDLVIKIAAGLVVAILAISGVYSYREAHAADVRAQAIEQERQRTVAAAAEARRAAERAQFAEWQAAHAARATTDAQATMYKCRDAAGVVAIQNWPCASGAATEWERGYQARDDLDAAGARQRAAELARHEAEVAQYTQIYGDRPSAIDYSPGPQPSGNVARCAEAKRYRDAVYRQAGNHRTYDLIRRMDDYVYEACKDT
jgi:hypothetical protein